MTRQACHSQVCLNGVSAVALEVFVNSTAWLGDNIFTQWSLQARSLSLQGWRLIALPLRALAHPSIHFQGILVDPLLRASNDINAPSKLARYLFRDGG